MNTQNTELRQELLDEFECYQAQLEDIKKERNEIEKRLQSSNLVLAILLGISVSIFIFILTLNLNAMLYLALGFNITSFIIFFFTLLKSYEKCRFLSIVFDDCDYHSNMLKMNDRYGFFFENYNLDGINEAISSYKHAMHESQPRITSVSIFERFIYWGIKGGICFLVGSLVVFCFWKSYLIGLIIVVVILIVYILFTLFERFLKKEFRIS